MPEKEQEASFEQAVPATVNETEIEGGFVDEIYEPPFDEPKHRAVTAQRLALLFAGILAGALGIHYVCFMVLAIMGRDQSIDSLGRIFNVWLPALTGIVSSCGPGNGTAPWPGNCRPTWWPSCAAWGPAAWCDSARRCH